MGVGAALSLHATEANESAVHQQASCTESIELSESWQFRLDPTAAIQPVANSSFDWRSVSVPHTWQRLGENPEYAGVAWYRKEIFASAEWQAKFVRVEFEAVFHTAHIFLNGRQVGEHIGKGYTAFRCDLSPHIKYGEPNELVVRVDNSFSNTMLPRMKSFDWANDGGIVRPVHLLVTPRVFIERIEIDATPADDFESAKVAVRAVVRNTLAKVQAAVLSGILHRGDATKANHAITAKTVQMPAGGNATIALDEVTIQSPALWHFDAPNLYLAEIFLNAADERHAISDTIGIRKFEARGTQFYLNGERVLLMGVERMAGSHPEFGMAEPAAWIEANHRDMKELNCVFTRVHWPQDKRVLDFCDRHGILMQEEVPAWGPFTFKEISPELQSQLKTNGLEQLREMLAIDRNHPCIVSWGLCNEVDGKNPVSRDFANAIAKEARALDPARLLTYASHTLRDHPEDDMAGDFDFISGNEYFGSWSPGGPSDVRAYLERIRHAFPNKPIVVSEYGWCECQATMPAGDQNRVNIVDEHTSVIRETADVAGAIYFDLNDYRTIAGDKGEGALRQRVHGVVDLYANRKPSFAALRIQSSPVKSLVLIAKEDALELHVITRKGLPAYTLRGYSVRWLFYGYDDLPMDGKIEPLHPLAPGSDMTLNAKIPAVKANRVVADILRPGGFSVATAQLTLP